MTGIGTGRSCNGGGITMTNRTAQQQQLRIQPVPPSALDLIAKNLSRTSPDGLCHINL
jgi:hypothetical protein